MFSSQGNGGQATKQVTESRQALHWHRSSGWILLSMVLAATLAYLAHQSRLLPIRSIGLNGNFQYLDQRQVESTLKQLSTDSFFMFDIQRAQAMLSAKPWTESVSIRRVWPDQLQVVIAERKPVARWDQQHLVSDKAVVFQASANDFAQLPKVYAADGDSAQVLAQYHQLTAQFDALNEQVVCVHKDSRGALTIELASDLVIRVGRQAVAHKIARLISIYDQQIRPRRQQIKQIDLRYSNGFAIAWRKEALQQHDEASLWRNSSV